MALVTSIARAVAQARGVIRKARDDARRRVDRAVAAIQAGQKKSVKGGAARSAEAAAGAAGSGSPAAGAAGSRRASGDSASTRGALSEDCGVARWAAEDGQGDPPAARSAVERTGESSAGSEGHPAPSGRKPERHRSSS